MPSREKLEKKRLGLGPRRQKAYLLQWGLKLCGDCDTIKPLDDFRYARSSKDRRQWRCRACQSAIHAKFYRNNAEAWKQGGRDYTKRNPHLRRAILARYRAAQKRALPSWANREKIAEIYARAKELMESTGIVHEVDHIVPIQSPVVCGLHWEGNLQVLTQHENRMKCNRLGDNDGPWSSVGLTLQSMP